jgi:hypothetical protein
VPEVSGEAGIAVSALGGVSVMDTSVVATGPSVAVTVPISVAAFPPQADKTSTIRAATTNSLLIIFSLLGNHV